MTKRCNVVLFLAIALAVFGACGDSSAGNTDDPEGMLCLTPVLERSCIAIKVPVHVSEALSGIRWYNNDGQYVYSKILIASGLNEVPPRYGDAIVMAENVNGVTQGWSEVEFTEPVASLAEALYVIFQLAPYEEQTGEGFGEGPGVGYVMGNDGSSTFISSDGDNWARLHMSCDLLVEPICVPRGGGMMALSNPHDQYEERIESSERITGIDPPFPNPFNPTTCIRFTLKTASHVKIEVFDIRGRLIRILFDGIAEVGPHVVEWDGRDHGGQSIASGMYFARMKTAGKTLTQRMLLLR